MLTQSRLIELQNILPEWAVALTAQEAKLLVDELVQQRADRVKLQGEIERLTHELSRATGAGAQRGRGWAHLKDIEALSERIDKVCDIIGARIGGLEDRLTELRYMFDQAETRTVNLLDAHSTDIAALKFPDGAKQDGAAFPTGAATTVEDALRDGPDGPEFPAEAPVAESEPLKPQRGDRVRLENAKTPAGRPISGWFDVVGGDESEIQIAEGFGRPWILRSDPGLKEVRRGAANLPE